MLSDSGLARDRRFILAVETTLKDLLLQEDLDGNGLITVDDHGPKV